MGWTRHPLLLLIRVNLLQGLRRLSSVREQSRLLNLMILLFIGSYFTIAFWLFYRGLRFVQAFPGLGTLLTERLLYLLFAFLFVLLLFSNLVISYTNLFRNRETAYLLSLPISSETVYRWKFIESTILASWAFLFLIAPLLAAYGLSQQLAWHFYVVTTVFVAVFIVLPAAGGSWLAINLARYMDRRTFQLAAVLAAAVSLVGAAFWFRPEAITDEMLETRVLSVLDRLLVKTSFAQHALLPSYWLTTGVLHWAEGARGASIFFGLVLLSHVLLFGFLAFTKMGNIFYDGYSAVHSRGHMFGRWEWFAAWQRKRSEAKYDDGWLERLARWIGPSQSDVRALILKDIRVFWRDTSQWGQTLVLFGLLGVYIINLRHFSHQLTNPFWVALVSYLNLGACSLNLATLTTRFVYPQFSLEGKRLWIVGMAPLGLVRVVRIKFWLATTASLVVTLGLIWLSCHMLKMPWQKTLFFAGAIAVMTFALNGLAVGLGVLYPNFKEDNPSKIVSGFGGTFCLVLSFFYIAASVRLLAAGAPFGKGEEPGNYWILGGLGAFLLLSAAVGWLPLRLGFKQLKGFEY